MKKQELLNKIENLINDINVYSLAEDLEDYYPVIDYNQLEDDTIKLDELVLNFTEIKTINDLIEELDKIDWQLAADYFEELTELEIEIQKEAVKIRDEKLEKIKNDIDKITNDVIHHDYTANMTDEEKAEFVSWVGYDDFLELYVLPEFETKIKDIVDEYGMDYTPKLDEDYYSVELENSYESNITL